MNSRVGILSVVLALQLAIIGLLLMQRSGGDTVSAGLLDFDPSQVSEIRITERDSQEGQLQLARTDDGWRSKGLPVDLARVEQLLERLAGLDSPWPVATTAAAAQRFEVTKDGYAKYVEMFAGDQSVGQLLLGTSPGFKRIHARRPEQDAIFSVALSSLDLPVALNHWLDKTLLGNQLTVNRVARLGHWEAVRDGKEVIADGGLADAAKWSLRALDSPAAPNAVSADANAVAALLGRFGALQVIGASAADGQPIDTFELDGDNGSHRYTLFHDEEVDRFTIARDDFEGRFELAGHLAEQLRADLGNLVQATSESEVQSEPGDASSTPDA